MGTSYGPGSLGVPFPQPKKYQEEHEAVAPKGWEKTVLRMKKHSDITNPWALSWWMKNRHMHPHPKPRHETACGILQALTEMAATESRTPSQLLQAAVSGDWSAQLQVTATCRLLGLLQSP